MVTVLKSRLQTFYPIDRMKPIEETFLELDWDSEEEARQARDARAAELQAQGLFCILENLYNIVNGRRVFVVIATKAEPLDSLTAQDSKRRDSRSDGSKRRSLIPKSKTLSGAEPEIR
jgi:hypothetical protein